MGGGGSHTTQTTTQELSPEQRALLEPVIPIATDYLKNPPQLYPGSTIAPQTDAEKQAQAMMLQAGNSANAFTSGLPQQMANIQGGQAANVNQIGNNSAQQQAALMQQIQQMFTGGAANSATLGSMMTSGNAQTQPALDTLLNPNILNASSNPYLQSYMEAATRPLEQQYAEKIMPGIAGSAITAGGYGGSRQGIAEGLASRGLSQASGDTTAKIASEGYGQGLNAMLGGLGAANTQQGQNLQAQLGSNQLAQSMYGTGIQGLLGGAQNQIASTGQQQTGLANMMSGLGMSPDIIASMSKPAEMVSAVGAQQRAEQQAQLSEAVNRFMAEQNIPFTAAQEVAAMAFGMPGGSTTSTGQTTGGGPGPLQMGLGAVSALPALLSLFGFSDRRMKSDIKYLGVMANGLSLYEYTLLGQKQLGYMADEVEELYPECVMRDQNGFQKVAYAFIPEI